MIHRLIIGIKGAGEMASAIAWRLYMANIRRIFMMEIPYPTAIRREVCFCEAIHEGSQTVEGVEAIRSDNAEDIRMAWDNGKIAVIDDPQWSAINEIRPDVVADAILAKKNTGTCKDEAQLVIGLGPGFVAGDDVHFVIETNRGHNMGRIITSGSAEPDTGVPGAIRGFSKERMLRAPVSGIFQAERAIGDIVKKGEVVGTVEGVEIEAKVNGVIRGIMRSGIRITKNFKLGDIDPRGDAGYCYTISDKARAVAGSVLEAVLRVPHSS